VTSVRTGPIPSDKSIINVNLDADIRFWTRNLGVSEDRLRGVVVLVGPLPADVRLNFGADDAQSSS
jgi:hypothetical protein